MSKLFIPFEDYKRIGGPGTFMANLKEYLDDQNFEYSTNLEESEAIFFPVSYDTNELKKIKDRGGKLIQRLDGVYYPSAHGPELLKFGDVMKDIYLNYSDFIVFQSEYSKKQCFEMFGEKDPSQYEIIINGVNKRNFHPLNNEVKEKDKYTFIMTGNFREPAMLPPIVKAFDKIVNQVDFEFKVVGPVNEDYKEFLDRPYINYLGPKPLEEIPEELRKSDILVYSLLNPACPNTVIEAISTGLPVVGFNTGSMSELLYFSTDLLAFVADQTFQTVEQFDPSKLAEKILLTIKDFKKYKEIALKNTHLYSFDETGAKYIEVFKKIINQN